VLARTNDQVNALATGVSFWGRGDTEGQGRPGSQKREKLILKAPQTANGFSEKIAPVREREGKGAGIKMVGGRATDVSKTKRRQGVEKGKKKMVQILSQTRQWDAENRTKRKNGGETGRRTTRTRGG